MGKYEEIAREILEEICETDEIFDDYDMDLIEEGYIDSFALVEIIVMVEEKLGVTVSPTETGKEDITTVNNFIAFLERIDK